MRIYIYICAHCTVVERIRDRNEISTLVRFPLMIFHGVVFGGGKGESVSFEKFDESWRWGVTRAKTRAR